ncbi:MAG: hypothetical protein IPQ07_40265 [Myxococcales bacterium]|nr:hypothetical protein [Myxococcales bacterium]
MTTVGDLATWGSFSRGLTCQPINATKAGATSGTVTLTTVKGNVFAGTYDVLLNSGDHVTGVFEPGACPALDLPPVAPKCL